jgi:glycosyltransferase involved in cell wall biosynthesis
MHLALFLTYFFPPLGGGGVQRSAKFARYLPDHGWRAVVVSVKPNRRNSTEQGVDFSLLDEVKDRCEIFRVRPVELSGLYYFLYRMRLRKLLLELERLVPFLGMEYKIGWFFAGLKQSKEILKRFPIRVIYSSSPPYSAHLIAGVLKREFGLPWVADFRDSWTQAGTYNVRKRLHVRIDRKLENGAVMDADAVIANTVSNRDDLIRGFAVHPAKIHVIPNGFDPGDFPEGEIKEDVSPGFIVSCVGKLHQVKAPVGLARAFRRFHEEHPTVLLKFLGRPLRPALRIFQSLLPPEAWEYSDRIDHPSAIRVMRESALLLADVANERYTHLIPGKLYEYLAVRKPILFIGPEDGDAANLIRETKAGKVVAFEEQSIYEGLTRFYEEWRHRGEWGNTDAAVLAAFDRRKQTYRLAQIFNELVFHPE